MKTAVPNPWPIPVFAHRGARAYKTENTIPAFERAIELEAPGIELDVHLIGDTLMVFHKYEDIIKLAKSPLKKPIQKYDSNEMKGLWIQDGKKEGGYIPSLEQALDCINKNAVVNIHLKGPGTGEFVAETIKEYVDNNKWKYSDFIVSAETKENKEGLRVGLCELRAIRGTSKKIPIGLLVVRNKIKFHEKYINELYACSLHTKGKRLEDKFISDAHDMGLKVYTYKVDGKHKAKRDMADGFFTDDPKQELNSF